MRLASSGRAALIRYSRFRYSPESARALNGDEMVAAAAFARGAGVGRDGAGNVVAAHFAERVRLRERVRAAIGVGHRLAAGSTRGETCVDAIAVRLVGEDEHALLGVRRRARKNDGQRRCGNDGTHNTPSAAISPRTRIAMKPNNATVG